MGLFVIYFDNNTDGMTMSCHKNKLSDSGFQPCCGIFDIISRSLESNSEINFKKLNETYQKLKFIFDFMIN